MSEEKIKIPIYTTGELNAIDNTIMTDFDNLVNTAIEQIYKDRECIALQKIIKEQQKEIEELTKQLEKEKEKNEELEKYKKYYETEKVVWSRNDYISKDKIKNLIHSYSVTDERFMKYLQELLEERN